jgi:hypothetical protein
MRSSRCALILAVFVGSTACVAHEPPPPAAQPGSPEWTRPLATRPILRPPLRPVVAPVHRPEPRLLLVGAAKPKDWRGRTALALAQLEERDPALYTRLLTAQPDRKVGAELFFSQPDLASPRAAPVLLKRLLNGDEPAPIRLAVVDALPATGGDWQEGAAALASLDSSDRVRKKLVEMLRYVPPPHNIAALRVAFRDEEIAVRVAAARTTGFARDGIELYAELVAASSDDDWDMRAAAAQALGQLRVSAAWDRLVRLLSDPRTEVRLQALMSLERIDAAAVRRLPDLSRLAKHHSYSLSSLARRIISQRSPEDAAAAAAATTIAHVAPAIPSSTPDTAPDVAAPKTAPDVAAPNTAPDVATLNAAPDTAAR